ncbi:Crp/Fnr family transcriptional regulator [Microvirga antarctica]|uniref:Crp/Fnr family transcriptional regulator n=1 Tax=Microvirga antarctica TaxID=2819233 RepID=UPI001B3168C1|nr:Crp/Fnr family transcriptional regulator [Microvirga antarctica]
MRVPTQVTVQNRLLQRMAPGDFDRIQPFLERVDLPLRLVLVHQNIPFHHVWFLEEGLGSIIAAALDDEKVEVAHVGRDGLAGKSAILGVTQSTNMTFMQIAGSGFRMPTDRLTQAMDESKTLRPFLMRYVHVAMTQLSQTALANGRYNLQERLARWLLMCHDRSSDDDLALTHEFLSLMLGVRRSGVTEAIHLLEGMHLIKATRGQVRILKRDKLEQIAGGCYGVTEAEYSRLIG